MRKGMKIILIIVAFLLAGFVLAISKEMSGSENYGSFGVIISTAIFFAVRAIWKYNPKKEEPKLKNNFDDDKYKLDKTT